MPPRYVYWTIVIEGAPTAFRAREPEELLPSLKQIQRKTPGAVMKWFARGKLWDSPEQARETSRSRDRTTGRAKSGKSFRAPIARGGQRRRGEHRESDRRRRGFDERPDKPLRFRRDSEPGEPEPPPAQPPLPPGPDRPPKPGQEPPPDQSPPPPARIIPERGAGKLEGEGQ